MGKNKWIAYTAAVLLITANLMPASAEPDLTVSTPSDAGLSTSSNAAEDSRIPDIEILASNSTNRFSAADYIEEDINGTHYKHYPGPDGIFDTDDDLSEFESAFVTDAENGYSSADLARWFTNDGKLSRDEYRTQGGSSNKNVAILTYTGSTYKNFELEVEYTQHYNWVGVLFGSKEPGQYIDLNDVHSAENPTAAYVEYEGVRNFMGNIKNTNYYNRTDETIYNAREDTDFPEDYYTTANGHTGNAHKMKLRVVGDQAMLWFDDQTDPFVAELTNYEGGYISLFSTAKG